MSLERETENQQLQKMKAALLEQFNSGVNHQSGEYRIAAAESAKAYAMLVQTQLALENH